MRRQIFGRSFMSLSLVASQPCYSRLVGEYCTMPPPSPMGDGISCEIRPLLGGGEDVYSRRNLTWYEAVFNVWTLKL